MSKKTLYVVAIIAFIGGGIAGGVVGSLIATRFFYGGWGKQLVMNEAMEARIKVRLLKDIRNERYEDAVGIMEALLDSNIISLVDTSNLSEKDMDTINSTKQSVREYREQYPRTTKNKEIDETVAEILTPN